MIFAKINTEVHSILECTYFTKDSQGSSIRTNGGIVRIRIGQGPMGLQGPMLPQGPGDSEVNFEFRDTKGFRGPTGLQGAHWAPGAHYKLLLELPPEFEGGNLVHFI